MNPNTKSGDVVIIRLDGCENCGIEERDVEMKILFMSAEHELAVLKMVNGRFHAVVHLDENKNAIAQPCGTFGEILHKLHDMECEDDDEDG